MPPPQIFSLDGHAYGLTVSGVQVAGNVPVDLFPIRWEMPSDASNGSLTFTIDDQDGVFDPPAGSVVRLTDNTANTLLSSGVLVNRRYQRGIASARRIECIVMGWGLYLDRRYVTEFSWVDYQEPPGIKLLVESVIDALFREFGGPISTPHTMNPSPGTYPTYAGTATKTSLRGTLDALAEATTSEDTTRYYVDDSARLHFRLFGTESDVVGTATSIGDQGTHQPEYLTYETDTDTTAHYAHAYGTAAYAGVAPNYDGSSAGAATWDAGPTNVIWDESREGVIMDYIVSASVQLFNLYGDIASASFETSEVSGWAPGQEITVDDSVLTDGTAETHYIAAVSGEIDHRNIITWRVTTGAVARSIAQTVSGLT